MFQGMEYVYEVYLEKSFSKAAEKLFISQPSLSANVKRVEHHIGYPIFDRSTKPLSLTECGVQYIKAVEKIKSIQMNLKDLQTTGRPKKRNTHPRRKQLVFLLDPASADRGFCPQISSDPDQPD